LKFPIPDSSIAPCNILNLISHIVMRENRT